MPTKDEFTASEHKMIKYKQDLYGLANAEETMLKIIKDALAKEVDNLHTSIKEEKTFDEKVIELEADDKLNTNT